MDYPNTLGNRIKLYRTFANLTQKELGEKIGVTDKCVWSWESGRTEPNMGMMEKICKALGCKKSDLIPFDFYGENDFENLGYEYADALIKGKPVLNDVECSLIDDFRRLSDEGKEMCIDYVKYLISKK